MTPAKPPAKPRTRLTAETRTRILVDYIAGVRVEVIAARFGVAPSYPSILAKRRGLPRRTTKRSPA